MTLQPAAPSRTGPKPKLRRVSMRFASLRTITALILRDMSSSYGRSPGGYVWVILEPVLGIALLSAIFSLGFRTPRLGTNFAIFYATGLMPFFIFSDVSGKMSQAINYSKALLEYPRVTFMDALIARLVLSVLTQLLVSAIIFTFILSIWDTRTVLFVDRMILAFAMAIASGIGIGTLNCFLMTMYPLWQRAWSIITRPLVLVSGVMFLYEILPEWAQNIVWYNPIMHATGEMRGAFYLQYEAKYVSPAYVFGLSGVLLLLGLIFLRQYHRDMLER